jgi:ribosomal 30S subunit maturation factor RimM
VGCRVTTVAGDDVGVVKAVDAAAGGSRLVVVGAAGDVLIPLVAQICTAIDPVAKAITIDPPDGLLDVNA